MINISAKWYKQQKKYGERHLHWTKVSSAITTQKKCRWKRDYSGLCYVNSEVLWKYREKFCLQDIFIQTLLLATTIDIRILCNWIWITLPLLNLVIPLLHWKQQPTFFLLTAILQLHWQQKLDQNPSRQAWGKFSFVTKCNEMKNLFSGCYPEGFIMFMTQWWIKVDKTESFLLSLFQTQSASQIW